MNFIKKFFENKVRVGILIICLFMLYIAGISSVTKDTYAVDTSYTGVKNLIYYNQGSSGWANQKFCTGSKTIVKNGCGATSLAMMASTFTSSKYNPGYVADWICDNGHADNGKGGGGLGWKYFTMEKMLDDFDLAVETLFAKNGKVKGDAGTTYDSTEGNALLNAVKQGKGIILHIPGHYVAVGPNDQCSSNEVYYYNVGRSSDNGCYTPKALFNKTYNYKNRCTDNGNCGWKAAFAYTSKSMVNYKVKVYFNANGAELGNSNYKLGSTNNILRVSNGYRYYKEYDYDATDIDLPNYNGTTFKMSYEGYKNASPVWNTKADGSGTKFYQTSGKHDAKELCDASNGDCTVTLYAQWTPIKYYIHYVGNGNTSENYTTGHCDSNGKCGLSVYTSGTTYDSSTGTFKHATKYAYDTKVTLRKNRFVKEGYTFAGWATSATGSVKYNNQAVVSNLSSIDGVTIKLYAQWKANTYTIKYDSNGGTGIMADSIHTYGKSKTLTTNDYTREGYTFVKLNTKANGNGTSYKGGTSVNNLIASDDGTITLYAQWKADDSIEETKDKITYYVKYDSNYGTGTMSNSTHIYSEGSDLATNMFTRTGYVFDGWNTDKNGNGTSYVDGQTIADLTSTDGTTVTLYAQWVAEEKTEIDKVADEEDVIDDNTEEEIENEIEEEVGDANEDEGDIEEFEEDKIEESPETGSLATILVSLIGVGALGCFGYYRRKLKK